jgi:hypothetical protein
MNNGFSIILFVYLWLIAVNIALEVINDEARDAHRPIANDYIILPIDGACCYQQLNVDSEGVCTIRRRAWHPLFEVSYRYEIVIASP